MTSARTWSWQNGPPMPDLLLDVDHGGGSGHAPNLHPFVKAKRASSPTDDESWKDDMPSPTLNAFDNGGESRATVVIVDDGTGPTLPVAFSVTPEGGQGADLRASETDVANTLRAIGQMHDRGVRIVDAQPDLAVRRLTPRECERLMGWPDDHTATGVDADGNPVTIADSARYRMCGNGVASPVAEYIGRHLIVVAGELGL